MTYFKKPIEKKSFAVEFLIGKIPPFSPKILLLHTSKFKGYFFGFNK